MPCAVFSSPNIIRVIKKNEMGGECGTFGGQERCIRGFDGEARGKETTWKTSASMGGKY